MVGPLRSCHGGSLDGVGDISDIEKLLFPLQDSISQISSALHEIKSLFERKLDDQNKTIRSLLKRVTVLESSVLFNRHMSTLHERKLDDMEQFSRKINLRVEGIPVEANDSPEIIMDKIKGECEKLNIAVCGDNFDRCQRVNQKYTHEGKTYQSVLLKLNL